MSKRDRTDPHRPGAIIPAEYDHVLSYAVPGSGGLGCFFPGFGVNCKRDRAKYEYHPVPGRPGDEMAVLVAEGQHDPDGRCCIVGLREIAKVEFAAVGGTGKCSVCGAHYSYGDVWMHRPTGQHVHLGHTCVDKYEMLVDRSRFELELGRRQKAAAVYQTRLLNAEKRQTFLDANPGLADDLGLDHRILRDLSDKLTKWLTLTPGQIALARKIAAEIRAPKPEAVEVNVPAPTGRVTFTGVIVSVKDYPSDFARGGYVEKMTVKVTTPSGVWLAWGTVPSGLGATRGRTVTLTATLTQGRDPHFALYKRPTGAELAPEPTPEDPGPAPAGPSTPSADPQAVERAKDTLSRLETSALETLSAAPAESWGRHEDIGFVDFPALVRDELARRAALTAEGGRS